MPAIGTLLRAFFAVAFLAMAALAPATAGAQDATPTPITCADVAATPSDGTSGMPGMQHGAMDATPGAHAGHGMAMAEFDLMYIDMMIPHHESIIALATVAVNELEDPRLIEIAEAVITAQTAENEEMQRLRDEWYPGAEPVSMDMMMQGMPGMGDMMAMEQQMSAEYQVATFCAAEDKDLAFIDLAIPHHRMAIVASEAALTQAVHPELVAIAEDVIAAQEAEIVELEAIRAELTGEATPAS
jgi:uncharacterized protein (DUF305 family)